MPLFLDLCYLTFVIFGLPYFLYRVVIKGKYRQGWSQRLGKVPVRKGKNPCLWIHGVSVGEVLAARNLVKLFCERFPDWDVVISTTTPSGHAVARQNYPEHSVFYFPMDLSWMVRRAFCRLRPTLVTLLEVELWPNFLWEAHRQSVPVVLVSGSLSETSFRRYRRLGSLSRRMLEKVALFCMQTEDYARKITNLGVPENRVVITASMKYDNLLLKAGKNTKLADTLGLARAPVLMAGSTHEGEEEALLDSYCKLREKFPELRLVIVPRHPERFDKVEQLIRDKGLFALRKSSLDAGQQAAAVSPAPVLLVDTLGELAKLYEVADLVFVGGSLVPVGGHNLLEPAACGKAVLFGPQVFKQRESADQLLGQQAAIQVRDEKELAAQCDSLLSHPQLLEELGQRALAVIRRQQGASQRTLEALANLIEAR